MNLEQLAEFILMYHKVLRRHLRYAMCMDWWWPPELTLRRTLRLNLDVAVQGAVTG